MTEKVILFIPLFISHFYPTNDVIMNDWLYSDLTRIVRTKPDPALQ